MPQTSSEPIPAAAVLKGVAAAALVALGVWQMSGAATGTGSAYRDALADAYAAKLLVMADQIHAAATKDGVNLQAIVQAGESEFSRYRQYYFNRDLLPKLEAAAGGKDAKITDANKAAVEKVLRDVAAGLSPRHAPLPPAPAPTPTPTPAPAPQAPDQPGRTGWVDDPAARARIAATLPKRTLSEAAPGFFATDTSQDVFLYRAWKDVLGAYPQYPAQQIGDCTSFGSSHALDLLQCIDIRVYGLDKSSYQETCTEATYGFSREEAGLLHSWGDGSFGVATGKALMEHGTVSRQFVGAGYSGSRAKQWGNSGCPDNVRTEAQKHRLGGATLVTTTAEADAALNNGYPFIICSNQGFTMARDATGACQPRGSWGHCMFVAGARTLNGARQYLICQSWGPNTPSGPTTDDQPDFSFWCDSRTMGRILDEQDSMVFSRFAGFTPRPIPDTWRFNGFARVTEKDAVMADPPALHCDGEQGWGSPPPTADPAAVLFPARDLPASFRLPAFNHQRL